MKKWIFALMAIFIVFTLLGCPEPDNGGGKKEDVTVSFDLNSFMGAASTPAPITVKSGAKITLPSLTSDVMAHTGWSETSGQSGASVGAGGASYTAKKSLTLYAKHTGKDVNITYVTSYTTPTARSWKNPPTFPTTVKTFEPIGAGYVVLTSSDSSQEFIAWALHADGTEHITNAWIPTTASVTLYLVFRDLVAPGQPISVQYIMNGLVGDAPADPTGTTSGGAITLATVAPTNPVQKFLGWAEEPVGPVVAAGKTFNYSPVLLYAQWESQAVPTFEERAALMNSSTIIYEFILPPGTTLGDYTTLAFDVKLLNPGNADENSPEAIQVRDVRLMGPYTKDIFTDVEDSAYIARFVSGADYLVGWIASQKGSTYSGNYANYLDGFNSAEADKYYEIEHPLTGEANVGSPNSTKSGNNWHPESTGPLYFGLGINGNQSAISQSIKNVRLIGASGVKTVYSVSSGFDKPAFAGWRDAPGPLADITYDRELSYMWRDDGDKTEKMPFYVVFSPNGGTGSSSFAWLKEGVKDKVTIPSFTYNTDTVGHHFRGWSTTKHNPIAAGASLPSGIEQFTNESTFSASAVYYAVWQVNPDYVAAPEWNTLTNKYSLGKFTWTNPDQPNGPRQRGWPTWEAPGVNAQGADKKYSLALEDLQSAHYLVIQVESLGTAGWDLRLRRSADSNLGFPGSGTQIINSGSVSSGITYVKTADGTGDLAESKLVIIHLATALPLIAAEEKWCMVAIQYYEGDIIDAWDTVVKIKDAWLLFDENYTKVSPKDPFVCTCDPATCAKCTDGCTCSAFNNCMVWSCQCADCARLSTSCTCTEENCDSVCSSAKGCDCFVPCNCTGCAMFGKYWDAAGGTKCTIFPGCAVCQKVGYTLETTYQIPADAPQGSFYMNLNDYKYIRATGIGQTAEMTALTANSIKFKYDANAESAVIAFSTEQLALLAASAQVKIEITATVDEALTTFRYHLGGYEHGGDWNSTSGSPESVINAAWLTTTQTYTANRAKLNSILIQTRFGGVTTAPATLTIEKILITPIAPTVINNFDITLKVPVAGVIAPQTIDSTQFTGAVTWAPPIAAGAAFAVSTEYTASIVIAAKGIYTTTGLTGTEQFKINGENAASFTLASLTVVSEKFDQTAAEVLMCDDCKNPQPVCECWVEYWVPFKEGFTGVTFAGNGDQYFNGNYGVQRGDTTNSTWSIDDGKLVFVATGNWRPISILTGTAAGGNDYYWNATSGFNCVMGRTYRITINATADASGSGLLRVKRNGADPGGSTETDPLNPPGNGFVLSATAKDCVVQWTQTASNVTFDNHSSGKGFVINSIKIEQQGKYWD